jgi:glyoxalase family protein
VAERFGQSFLRFRHPAGLDFEVIEDSADHREPWTTPEISKGEATHGFHGSVLSVREIAQTESFFTEALGFRKTGTDGAYHRFETGTGGANKTVTLLHEPDRPAGSWTFGAGTVHHIALWGADDAALARQKAIYEELGYTDASEIKDRFYFHSMYCRCPGGILVESCCNVAESFERDETKNQLGKTLHLPPWFADRKAEIMQSLEPIRVPETAMGA